MKNQKGFSIVIVLLCILVVSFIGFAGYYVWNTQQDKKEKEVATVAGAQEQAPAVKEESQPTPTAQDAQKYLEIKEWGVKIPISEDLSDLTYRYNAPEDTVTLTTDKLMVMQKQLAGTQDVAQLSGIGLLSRSVKSYDQALGTAIQNDGPFIGYYVGTVGKNSYTLLPASQSVCPESNNTDLYKSCTTYENQMYGNINNIIRVNE